MATEKRMIDANALLHDKVWLCGGFVGDPYCDGYMEALDKVETVIREFPSVDAVEVKHGRWDRVIPSKSAAKWSTKVSCSNCHKAGYTRFNYCPNCGAKMDGDGNEKW